MRKLVAGSCVLIAMIAGCDDVVTPRGPGSLFITSSAGPVEPSNQFFYRIAVDGGTPREIFILDKDTMQVNGLAPGNHTVSLSGLPVICSAGELPREVTLRGDDTVSVDFNITCQRTTGDVLVKVTTTGSDLDPDGYIIHLNGLPRATIASNGEVTLKFLNTGNAVFALSGIASNCTATSPSQSVTIVAGVQATVNLGVTCSAISNIKTVVSVNGADADPDGVTLKLGNGPAVRVALGTAVMHVNPGQFSWQIGDVQPNCTLGGASSGTVNITAGDTATIAAALTCTDVGYGTATTVATEAAGDTLANPDNSPARAHDVLQVTTRYTPNWLIVVMRFAQPVGAVGGTSATALQGFIELDTDENVTTGFDPAVNEFGGNSQQGVDYGVLLFDAANSWVPVAKASENPDTTTHRVPLAIQGDSIVVKIPLAKLGGDDGNLSITAIVGTNDRPTDLVPNSGVVLGRAPAPVVASSVQGNAPKNGGKRSYEVKWRDRAKPRTK